MNDASLLIAAVKRRPIWLLVAIFISTAAILMLANRNQIAAMNYEAGDFAANSLLIQDAKHLQLLKGNYSRQGFNHPGPAILYVLAGGELVAHDWLHLVPSPLSGQLVAVAIYSAFWITLIFALFWRAVPSPGLAAVATSVFLVIVASFDFQFFTGLWFPYLYLLPFATFLLAAARLVGGKTDSLASLALASGFLVNGNASFFAIVAVIIVLVIGCNYYLSSRWNSIRRTLGASFLRQNRRPIFIAAFLFSLFLVPLLIETVANYPGPLWAYFLYGSGHPANSIAQAVRYTSVYWGGVSVFALPVAALLLWIRARHISRQVLEEFLSIVAVVASATFAMLFYALFGIDLLEHQYIGFFYVAAPALLIAAMSLTAFSTIQQPAATASSMVVSAACLAACFVLISRETEHAGDFNRRDVVDLYDALLAKAGNGRLVLDLDATNDWGHVWVTTLGVQAYAKRHSKDLFCINLGWHVMFTERAKCRQSEIEAGERFVVRRSGSARESDASAEINRAGLAFFRLTAAPPSSRACLASGLLTDALTLHSRFEVVAMIDPENVSGWAAALAKALGTVVIATIDETITLAGERYAIEAEVAATPLLSKFTDVLPRTFRSEGEWTGGGQATHCFLQSRGATDHSLVLLDYPEGVAKFVRGAGTLRKVEALRGPTSDPVALPFAFFARARPLGPVTFAYTDGRQLRSVTLDPTSPFTHKEAGEELQAIRYVSRKSEAPNLVLEILIRSEDGYPIRRAVSLPRYRVRVEAVPQTLPPTTRRGG